MATISLGKQCCFCSESIAAQDEQSAVTITGTNMRDWRTGAPDPRHQIFWAHYDCLAKSWTGTYPWEASALIPESDWN